MGSHQSTASRQCDTPAHGASGATLMLRVQQLQRVEVKATGDALQALEGQIALAPLDATHVGAVNTEHVGERLLAEAVGLPVGPQIAAHRALKIAFHSGQLPEPLLDSLHTYK